MRRAVARRRKDVDAKFMAKAVEIAKMEFTDRFLEVGELSESDLLASAYFYVDPCEKENYLQFLIAKSGCPNVPKEIRHELAFAITRPPKPSKTELEALITIVDVAEELDEAVPDELVILRPGFAKCSNSIDMSAGRPSRTPGQTDGVHAGRNIALRSAILVLTEEGMSWSRGSERPNPLCCPAGGSASDAAGLALVELGYGALAVNSIAKYARRPLHSHVWRSFPEVELDLLDGFTPYDMLSLELHGF